MKTINDGGPVHPVYWYGRDSIGEMVVREQSDGISLRDYFAAKAMQGLLCNAEVERYRQTIDGRVSESRQIEAISQMCYEMADAMLSAREAGK